MVQSLSEIYLDSAATCYRIPTPVLDEIMPLLKSGCGNASSTHYLGRKAMEYINKATERIKTVTGAYKVYYTSGSTESNNWVLNNFKDGIILATDVEHPSVTNTIDRWINHYPVPYSTNERKFSMHYLEVLLKSGIDLCAVISVNNETGDIFDTNPIYDLCHKYDCKLHLDLTQAFSHIDITKLKYDYASISAHKFGGLQGCGALLCNADIKPFITGGDQQDYMRAGTHNLLGIVAMGKAAEINNYSDERDERMRTKKNYLVNLLNVSGLDYRINTLTECTVPNILNFSIRNVDAEGILIMLDKEGIYVSAGSACSSGSLEPSNTLKAIGVPEDYVYGTLRVSMNEETTLEQLNTFVDKLVEIVNKLRRI